MDFSDIKRLATAAREFSVAVGPGSAPRHITLRLPTHHESVLAARRSGLHHMELDSASHVVLQRTLLLAAIVAWSGVLVVDVLQEHAQAAEPLPLEPGAAELLLDCHPEWETELGAQLLQRMAQRRAVQDTAEKN
jgi:hypothetical protein